VRSPKQNIPAPDIAELRDELRLVVQLLAILVNAASEGEAASFKLKKFLTRNDLSDSQYHKLRRQGRGPRVMSVGSCGVRISRQAELDWIAAREIEAEAAKETAATENGTSAPEEERPSDGPSNCPGAIKQIEREQANAPKVHGARPGKLPERQRRQRRTRLQDRRRLPFLD
jgi:hypothetical protein